MSWFCILVLWQHSTGAKKRVLVGFVRLWFPVPGFRGVPRGRQDLHSVGCVPVLVDGVKQHTTPGGVSRWVSIVPRFRLVPGAVLVLQVVPGCETTGSAVWRVMVLFSFPARVVWYPLYNGNGGTTTPAKNKIV